MQTTMQRVELGTKEGKSFLRRVARDYDKSPYSECWRVRCGESTDWKLRFERTITGELGEPDNQVSVDSDCRIVRRGKAGMVQSFEDSKPVQLLAVRNFCLTGSEVVALCSLLWEGAQLELVCSSGSKASAELGLSFYYLEVHSGPFRGVRIGGDTIACNGRTICAGAVRLEN